MRKLLSASNGTGLGTTQMKKFVAMALCAGTVSACASAPDKISAAYVSPMQYGSYDCDQIRAELIRVSAHVQEVSGVQNRAHHRDQWATGVGIVIFWPALFFLMEGDKKEELASLKGQYDALDEAAIQKKCPVADEIRAAQVAQAAQEAAKKQKVNQKH